MSLHNEILKQEMPYEKFKKYGPEALTDVELLAVFIRSGTKDRSCISIARELLGEEDSGLLKLCNKSFREMINCYGIGEVKAIQIACMLEVAKRIWRSEKIDKKSFNSAQMIAEYYMEEMRYLQNETVKLICLDSKCHLISDFVVSKGTVRSSLVSNREILIKAIELKAVFIVLIHNHPSGDSTPSSDDINVTKELSKACEIVGIKLLDHIVIGDNCYSSLSEYL